MDSQNIPVASSETPMEPPPAVAAEVVASTIPPVNDIPSPGADVPAASPAAAPSTPSPAPTRRIATTVTADVIGSLQSLMGTVVIALFVITFIVQAFQIPSQSMENTLLVGDYLLVNKLCYGGQGPGDHVMPYQKIARGDIIVFHYPVDPQQHFVKRVIGIPGDHLRMVNKKVLINGKPLDEPYVRFLEPANNQFRDNFPRLDIAARGLGGDWWLQMKKLVVDDQLIIPEGHYFVMGDNRDDSEDSRYWGFVPRENIIGRPLVIYWSLKDGERSLSASWTERLYHAAYTVTHLFQVTRWNRTLRLVH